MKITRRTTLAACFPEGAAVEASRRHVDRDRHGLAAHPEWSAACGIKAMRNSVLNLMAASAIAATLSVSAAHAQKKYDAGATDTEIKVGQTVPLSGPASAEQTVNEYHGT